MEASRETKRRGVLNNTDLKERILKKFPEFNITEFVRFLPYLDYVVKNQGFYDRKKMSTNECEMLYTLHEKGQIGRTYERIEFVTKEFYDLMQDVLFDCYVCIK